MSTDDEHLLAAPPVEHWDEDFAQTLIGKTILLGLVFLDDDGEVSGREQFFGVVIGVDAYEGIVLDLLGEHDGDTYTLPPQTSPILPAEKGVTSLAGDTPDFVVNWMIHGVIEPANDDED